MNASAGASEARYDVKRWAVFFDGPGGPDVLEVQAEDMESAAAIVRRDVPGVHVKRVRPLGAEASETETGCTCAHTHPPDVPSLPISP